MTPMGMFQAYISQVCGKKSREEAPHLVKEQQILGLKDRILAFSLPGVGWCGQRQEKVRFLDYINIISSYPCIKERLKDSQRNTCKGSLCMVVQGRKFLLSAFWTGRIGLLRDSKR